MMNDQSLAAYVQENNRILETEDMAAFRAALEDSAKRIGITVIPDSVVDMAFHKARYEAMGVSREKRLESGEWLRTHDVARMTGTPVLPKGQLPE